MSIWNILFNFHPSFIHAGCCYYQTAVVYTNQTMYALHIEIMD